MNNTPRTKLQTFLHSPLFLIVLGILLITIIAAIIFFFLKPNSSPDSTASSIRVANFSKYFPNLDTTTRSELEKSLYIQVSFDAQPSDSTTAIIRKDSLTTVDYNQFHTGDFIIDIKSLGLSYLVSFNYGTFAGREVEAVAFATFYCPTSDQLIYPVFACSANINYSRPSVTDLEATELSELSLTNE
ncbi:hypothetical protein IIZ77_00285 [Candidatus Saccharibacteria bacterium]|nr:hypothetical protein [Candidatus Saccharibacteria bacterium]